MIRKSLVAVVAVLAGCASYPVPVQRMADAEAANRSAQELGAAASPQGQLHLKLSQEEIAQAKQLVANSDNERADYVLIRAKADAELALAEGKELTVEQQMAQAQSNVNKVVSAGQPTTATVTTTATTGSTPTTSTSTTSTTTSGGAK